MGSTHALADWEFCRRISLSPTISILRQWDNDNSCLWISWCEPSTLPLYPVNGRSVLGLQSCHYFAMCSAVENMSSLLVVAPRGLNGSRWKMKPTVLFVQECKQRWQCWKFISWPEKIKEIRHYLSGSFCSLFWKASFFRAWNCYSERKEKRNQPDVGCSGEDWFHLVSHLSFISSQQLPFIHLG